MPTINQLVNKPRKVVKSNSPALNKGVQQFQEDPNEQQLSTKSSGYVLVWVPKKPNSAFT